MRRRVFEYEDPDWLMGKTPSRSFVRVSTERTVTQDRTRLPTVRLH